VVGAGTATATATETATVTVTVTVTATVTATVTVVAVAGGTVIGSVDVRRMRGAGAMRRSGGATRAAGSAARVHVSARAKGETTAAATIVAAAAATEALQSAAHRAAAGVCLLRRWAKGVVDAAVGVVGLRWQAREQPGCRSEVHESLFTRLACTLRLHSVVFFVG
jgi:hypothetical protein